MGTCSYRMRTIKCLHMRLYDNGQTLTTKRRKAREKGNQHEMWVEVGLRTAKGSLCSLL